MDNLAHLLARCTRLAAHTGQSISTISRKIMNDGKGLARLQNGGQCTLRTFERALSRLSALEHKAKIGEPAPPVTPPVSSEKSPHKPLTHFDWLEAQSIHILRETIANCAKPVLLYSMGKDSAVLLHLARKAFFPADIPFPLLHIDSNWKFREMLEFRDRLALDPTVHLLVYKNEQGIADGIGPFTHGARVHTHIMKTQALKQALDTYGFDAAFGGARREEEKSRAKERIFSIRGEHHSWDPKNQRPELWSIYNTQMTAKQSLRVFPLSNWTETDIWQYIQRENIAVPSLYFAAKRPVVLRGADYFMVDDERFVFEPGEKIQQKQVRFRTLGCYPLTAATPSTADTIAKIIEETIVSQNSERQSRVIDRDGKASMESKKQEGYF